MLSAITIVIRLVFAAGMAGITDASATHSPSIRGPPRGPRRRRRRRGAGPIAQVPAWVVVRARTFPERPGQPGGVPVADRGAGCELGAGAESGERQGTAEPACVQGRLDHPGHVLGVAQAGDVDARRIGRVSRTQAHQAPGADRPATMLNTPPTGLAASSNGTAAKRVQTGWPARVGQGERRVSITRKRGPAKPGVVGRSTAASGWSIRLSRPRAGQRPRRCRSRAARRRGRCRNASRWPGWRRSLPSPRSHQPQ